MTQQSNEQLITVKQNETDLNKLIEILPNLMVKVSEIDRYIIDWDILLSNEKSMADDEKWLKLKEEAIYQTSLSETNNEDLLVVVDKIIANQVVAGHIILFDVIAVSNALGISGNYEKSGAVDGFDNSLFGVPVKSANKKLGFQFSSAEKFCNFLIGNTLESSKNAYMYQGISKFYNSSRKPFVVSACVDLSKEYLEKLHVHFKEFENSPNSADKLIAAIKIDEFEKVFSEQ